jgi:hypothetical protein
MHRLCNCVGTNLKTIHCVPRVYCGSSDADQSWCNEGTMKKEALDDMTVLVTDQYGKVQVCNKLTAHPELSATS